MRRWSGGRFGLVWRSPRRLVRVGLVQMVDDGEDNVGSGGG